MKCLKHPWMIATRILKKSGQDYPMCADCSWKALKDGEALFCPENGNTIRLGENEEIFKEKK